MALRKFLKQFEAPYAPKFFFYRRQRRQRILLHRMRRRRHPNVFILLPPPTAPISQLGTEGGAPSEGEGNAAIGGCFASIYKYIYMYTKW